MRSALSVHSVRCVLSHDLTNLSFYELLFADGVGLGDCLCFGRGYGGIAGRGAGIDLHEWADAGEGNGYRFGPYVWRGYVGGCYLRGRSSLATG